MKIYLAGSHSSGKTTLARYISKTYKLPLLTEVARSVLSERELNLKTLRTDIHLADDFQETIFFRQIKEEDKILESNKSFVSDRSIDCLAYTANHARILNTIKESKEYKDYINRLKEKDSILFFVRPSKETLAQDGVREDLNWEGVLTIDAMIKCLFEFEGLNYIHINTSNMQERIMTVDTIIQKLIYG